MAKKVQSKVVRRISRIKLMKAKIYLIAKLLKKDQLWITL